MTAVYPVQDETLEVSLVQMIQEGDQLVDRRNLTKYGHSSLKDYQRGIYQNRSSSSIIKQEIGLVNGRHLKHLLDGYDIGAGRSEQELVAMMDMSTAISTDALRSLHDKLERYKQRYCADFREVYQDIEEAHAMQYDKVKTAIAACLIRAHADKQDNDEEMMNSLLYSEKRLSHRMEQFLAGIQQRHSARVARAAARERRRSSVVGASGGDCTGTMGRSRVVEKSAAVTAPSVSARSDSSALLLDGETAARLHLGQRDGQALPVEGGCSYTRNPW